MPFAACLKHLTPGEIWGHAYPNVHTIKNIVQRNLPIFARLTYQCSCVCWKCK